MTNEQNNAVVTTDSQMPCPFCDGQAAVCISSTHRNGTFVYCLSCMASGHGFETKEEAITAWNTRQPETDGIIEALEARLAEADALIEKARSAMVFDKSWNVDAYILGPQFDAYLGQSK